MQNEGDIKDAFIVNNQSAIRKQQSGNLQNQPQNSERALSRLRARAKEISSHQRDLNFAPLLFCLAFDSALTDQQLRGRRRSPWHSQEAHWAFRE